MRSICPNPACRQSSSFVVSKPEFDKHYYKQVICDHCGTVIGILPRVSQEEWQYLIEFEPVPSAKDEESLNAWKNKIDENMDQNGDNAWELVSCLLISENLLKYTYKRPAMKDWDI